MTTKIFMHQKPMVRHTKRVKPATASISIALPADVVARKPGLYMQLRVESESRNVRRDATQLIVVPIDQLDEIETAIKALRAIY